MPDGLDGGAGDRLLPRWTTVDGRRIFAQVAVGPSAGRPPIVLVHGLGVSSRYLVPTARCLADRFSVFVPDLPGFGRSDRPSAALDIVGLGGALLGWLDAMAIDRAVLLGNSLGCQTVVELATRCPERAAALILTGPTGDPAVRHVAHWLGRLLRDLPREPFALIRLEALDYLKAGPRRLYRTAQAMIDDPFAAKLARVAQPALVVRGERDPILSQAWAEEMARRLPRGRLAVIPDAAHAVNYNAPRPLAALVAAFVAEAGVTAATVERR